MLGLPKGEVFLFESTDQWITEYEKESELILSLIGEHVTSIHHIGSTAIPGLKAKPIIDIAIELDDFALGFDCIEALSRLDYRHRIIPELPDRHYWSKGEPRTHQIHMYAQDSVYLHEQLLFRDKLREDSALKAEYESLKTELCSKYKNDKLTYAEAKTQFIMSVVQ
ncbi:GrpB family protein [Veronia pacifica]|uniref:GrpB family protein n=1 Tax=Veronia pacifica TaxID=1080227 RepID=A0A1C3E848_9GAMM|nr:GrpB family protein [Veronia pacifica]ODA29437.1 hypothetical protein A8L45_22215 [Veronia pacifica]